MTDAANDHEPGSGPVPALAIGDDAQWLMSRSDLVEPLQNRFGRIEGVRPMEPGTSGNLHWRLDTSEGQCVLLRRYSPDRTLAQARWEQDLLDHLRGANWPVASCLLLVGEEPEIFGLFEYVAGDEPGTRTAEGNREAGRHLARFHQDVAGMDIPQCPGRTAFVDSAGHLDWDSPFTEAELLASLAETEPETADLIEASATQVSAVLGDGRADSMPRHAIHGDWGAGNLAFTNGQLTALYDFDYSRVDVPATDIARAWRGEHQEVVAGYEEVAPLSEAVRESLLPLWQSAALSFAWFILESGHTAGTYSPALGWCVGQLRSPE